MSLNKLLTSQSQILIELDFCFNLFDEWWIDQNFWRGLEIHESLIKINKINKTSWDFRKFLKSSRAFEKYLETLPGSWGLFPIYVSFFWDLEFQTRNGEFFEIFDFCGIFDSGIYLGFIFFWIEKNLPHSQAFLDKTVYQECLEFDSKHSW